MKNEMLTLTMAAMTAVAVLAGDYVPGTYANVREKAKNTLKYAYSPNRMFEKIAAGELAIGGYVGSLDPQLCEEAGFAGLDFVWIDMEHRPMTVHDLHAMQMALEGTGCASLIRVRNEDFNHVKPIVDIGVDGIIFPQIANYEAAVKAVEACRYPQAGGKRGICVGRQSGYGKLDLWDYLKRCETWPLVIIELEDEPAIRDLDRILTLKDVDAIMVGPSDLACSMGSLRKQGTSEVQDLVDLVAEKTRKAGKLFFSLGSFDEALRRGTGFYCGGGDSAGAWREMYRDATVRAKHYRDWTDGPAVTLATKNAAAKIALDGAKVLSYVANGQEVLWMSRVPGVPGGKGWNHGGIPVCWPHFGAPNEAMPYQHGFVRNFRFRQTGYSSSPECSRVVLQLKSDERTRAIWPHDFTLQVEFTLTDSLRMVLRTVNTGKDAFTFTGGFHPYFRIGERDRTTVTGTDALPFCDSRVTDKFGDPWKGDMKLLSSFDHVFVETRTTTAHSIVDPVLGRTIVGTSSGVPRLVVWNPGTEEPAAGNPGPGGLAVGDWRNIVCVEPAIIWKDAAVALPPGGRHEITFEISVSGAVK